MNYDEQFQSAYETLNEEQRAAVDAIDGPVMVVAGPGTGKTQVLTMRIANIIRQTDTDPSAILALTFTEAGATNMRERLATLIGPAAYQVAIMTFHGFCNGIITTHPESFPRIIGATPAHEVDQIDIITSSIDSNEFTYLRPFGEPYLYVRDCMSKISELKREGISPEAFRKIIDQEKQAHESRDDLYHKRGAHAGKKKKIHQDTEKRIAKNEELLAVYQAYQDALFERRVYDYNDMIMEVLAAVQEDSELLQALQETYLYVLVDEHQDTNNAQNKVIEELLSFHESPNLFVVGDEKQAIFRFQGASLENFYYFKRQFPDAKLVTLTKNYRSTDTIIGAAEGVLASTKPLQAAAATGTDAIAVAPCEDTTDEALFVAWQIKDLLDDGVPPDAIAVLYRENKDAAPIARVCDKLEIPTITFSNQNILAQRDIMRVLHLLEAAVYVGNDAVLAEALHVRSLGIAPMDIYRATTWAHRASGSLFDVLTNPGATDESFQDPAALKRVGMLISLWQQAARNDSPVEVVEQVIRESGLLEEIIDAPDAGARLDALDLFLREVERLMEAHPDSSCADVVAYIELIGTHNLFTKQLTERQSHKQVQLMTVHRAKGQEFQYVFIVGAYDGHFGNKKRPDRLPLLDAVYATDPEQEAPDANAEERRLFYVALTRAQERVTITYPQHGHDGKELLPTQFLAEIPDTYTAYVSRDTFLSWKEGVRTRLFEKPAGGMHQGLFDVAVIAELFDVRGLSVTALNNYLTCPWQYFFRNLVRIPSVPNTKAKYGTAVHEALQIFFDTAKREERIPPKEVLLDAFTRAVHGLGIAQTDAKDVITAGTEALSGYYDTWAASWHTAVETELKIRGVSLDDIPLTGALDKVVFDQSGEVHVVDYKTTQPMSRNAIMGKTKSSDGAYYRQLVFYKLLLSLYENGRYEMASGVIDFIEPNTSGKYKQERFIIDDAEVAELTETIKQVAEEIRTGAFLNQTCDDDACEACKRKELLTLRS